MNRYFQEVVDAHKLIACWLGEADIPAEAGKKLLARFSPAFAMVTPGGVLLDYAGLEAFFYMHRGTKSGLKIDIMQMQIIAENDRGATVCYQERQQLPGRDATLRFATVVFESDPQGKISWRHLHETALN